jgi:hypothetical protein
MGHVPTGRSPGTNGVVGEWNVNRGGTARTEGRGRSERPGLFMQPEFLPGAGDWKGRRNVLPCNAWLDANPHFSEPYQIF